MNAIALRNTVSSLIFLDINKDEIDKFLIILTSKNSFMKYLTIKSEDAPTLRYLVNYIKADKHLIEIELNY